MATKGRVIALSIKDHKLLMKVLKEASEKRSDMGCNDPYGDEEKMYTKAERMEMQKVLYGKKTAEELGDGFLYNSDYVDYLIKKLK